MLIFTNRAIEKHLKDESSLTNAFTPFADTLGSVNVKRGDNGNDWKVSEHVVSHTDVTALKQLTKSMSGDAPVLVYLHGNNNSPGTCFTRCQQLEDQYGVAVVGFSWTSEGFLPNGEDQAGLDTARLKSDEDEDALKEAKSQKHLQEGWIARKARRYGQAKLNAQHSKNSLARFLRLVAAARLGTLNQKVSLAAHSLGCHFLYHSIDEQDAEASLGAMHNVILIAGCTDASKHAAWIGQINPILRVYITFTKADSVLAAARVIDKGVKLGAEPLDSRVFGQKYRYIDFEGASKMKFGAHRYFVADPGGELSKQAATLFGRIFRSGVDIEAKDKSLKVVYPVGCSDDRSVCYMGNAGSSGSGS